MFVFVESRLFSRLVHEYLSDEEYAALQRHLVDRPQAGDVIRGSGGVRKLRWRGSGRGKRGGLRIIYLLREAQAEIWLLTLYTKNVSARLPAETLRRIKEEIDGKP